MVSDKVAARAGNQRNQQSRFRTMALVRDRASARVGVTACCWSRRKHRQEFSATRGYLLLTKCSMWTRMSPVSAH